MGNSLHVRSRGRRLGLVAGLVLVVCVSLAAQGSPPGEKERHPGFQQFQERVNAYVKLRKGIAEAVPALKPDDRPEQIKARRLLLAQKMMVARKDARQGDIFAPDAAKAFRKQINRTFSGAEGRELRKTISQGSPVRLRLQVNQTYPEDYPVTTMPPTLLLELPVLPPEVEYRVVGRDLVLQDAETRLILDFIREVYPKRHS